MTESPLPISLGDQALAQINKPAPASKKWLFALLGLLAATGIGAMAVHYRADPALVGVVASNLVLIVGGYVGFTNWQERTVRSAALKADE